MSLRTHKLSVEGYLSLIRSCCPGLEIRTVRPIEKGWTCFVLEVNGELIFRFPLFAEAEADVEKESLLLPVLAGSLSVLIPDFEIDCRPQTPPPSRFVGYKKIEGEPLTRELASGPGEPRLARQLGAVLSDLHGFPVEAAVEAGITPCGPGDWRRQYAEFQQWLADHAPRVLDGPAMTYTTRLWDRFMETESNFDFTPALVHQDLRGEHILCDPDRLEVNGIIDWGDASLGDPAIDFVGLMESPGRRFAEAVAAEYRGVKDGSFWTRAEFYLAVIPYHAIEHGMLTGSDLILKEGVAAVSRAAAEA